MIVNRGRGAHDAKFISIQARQGARYGWSILSRFWDKRHPLYWAAFIQSGELANLDEHQ
jgi:hypothetical protein